MVPVSCRRQLYFGKFDLQVHTAKEPINYTDLWNKNLKDISLVDTGNEAVEGYSSFAHLVSRVAKSQIHRAERRHCLSLSRRLEDMIAAMYVAVYNFKSFKLMSPSCFLAVRISRKSSYNATER